MSFTFKENGNITKGIKAGLRDAIEVTGVIIANQQKALAPVDTGRLRASVESGMISDEKGYTATNIEYAPYLEYGTVNMVAQPFMKPGVSQGKAQAVPAAAKALANGIARNL